MTSRPWSRFKIRGVADDRDSVRVRLAFITCLIVGTILADVRSLHAARVADASGKAVGTTMKIRISANGKTVMATLLDNAASRDFRAMLPLTLTLEDYAATEKIADLPKKLSTEDAPAGFDPSVGDLAYYAPWGNVAIFHKDAPYARGLVQLGHIDWGLEALPLGGPVQVRIETVEER